MESTRDRSLGPQDEACDSAAHPGRSGGEERGVELAPEDLSAEALRGLVEEFVSREGTDYGHVDRSLESKVRDVMRQLEAGEARIVFDLETETASIFSERDRSVGGERRGG